METTVKLDRSGSAVKLVAHRGLSGLERENTAAAFVAAGNRNAYFGIETDVYRTVDGQYVLLHDGRTGRVSDTDLSVTETPYEQLAAVYLNDRDGHPRSDLRIPTLRDYVRICRRYGKVGVLELKMDFPAEQLAEIVGILREEDYLDGITFISFSQGNMVRLRALLPDHPCQWLTGDWKPAYLDFIKTYRVDLDIYFGALDKATVDAVHACGQQVNVWTVDDTAVAARCMEMGVDYITTDILE